MASRSEAVGRSRAGGPARGATYPRCFWTPRSAVEIRCHEVPVDQRPELLEVGVPIIAMIDVIGVLPDVAGQERRLPVARGSIRIGRGHDLHRAGSILDEPGPAGSKELTGSLVELLLKVLQSTQALQCPGNLPARLFALGRETVPEEIVIPDLGGIVEDRAARLGHQLLERGILQLRAGDQLVQLVDVGLVMLAVVVIKSLTRHVRLERIARIGQLGQSDRGMGGRHDSGPPCKVWPRRRCRHPRRWLSLLTVGPRGLGEVPTCRVAAPWA